MLASITRTVVPLVVGLVLAYAAKVGLELPEGAVTEVVTAAVVGVYYAVARVVEEHVSPRLGQILLSLGLVKSAPVYEKAS